MSTWPSIDVFYEERPDRKRSGERDFGTWWREAGPNGPSWRVSLVLATGELYAVCLAGSWCEYGGQVELLGRVADGVVVEAALDGWADAHDRADGLTWVRNRMRPFRGAAA